MGEIFSFFFCCLRDLWQVNDAARLFSDGSPAGRVPVDHFFGDRFCAAFVRRLVPDGAQRFVRVGTATGLVCFVWYVVRPVLWGICFNVVRRCLYVTPSSMILLAHVELVVVSLLDFVCGLSWVVANFYCDDHFEDSVQYRVFAHRFLTVCLVVVGLRRTPPRDAAVVRRVYVGAVVPVVVQVFNVVHFAVARAVFVCVILNEQVDDRHSSVVE